MKPGNAFTVRRLQPQDAEKLQTLWRAENTKESCTYKLTNDEERYRLLYMVTKENVTVTEAAKRFNMRYSTAKNIVRLYLKEGRFEKRKFRKQETTVAEAKPPLFTNSIEQPQSIASESSKESCRIPKTPEAMKELQWFDNNKF